ncbi:GPR1/FUN34/YaaH family transporter [Haloactinomyces albus]|uniref:Succinate-acetate transporter protein n=1 Tax=Haloactinomyces albus TaxID=1352928 RepID=A0AAE3ZA02_9ACTN|nr:GPR1/FUN34/YaaH family transporter [Haloactinomyces albus]MDR7299858.1 succinate-acetate transporter protein [Haloactinomyces albus]
MSGESAAQQSAGDNAAMARIVLRPVASPMALGFLALGGATTVLSGLQLEWFAPAETDAVALALALFGFPLQLLASIFGFLARDAAAATGMGVLAVSWLTTGIIKFLYPPGTTSAAVGALLLFAGAALVIPALAASFGKVVPALVLFTAAVRFLLSGFYQVTTDPSVRWASGIVGVVLLALAWYAALALALEDVRGRTVLPVLRRGMGSTSMRGPTAQQLVGIGNEAGVREQL